MTLPSWGDAMVAEESHHLSSSLLERVSSHTTTPATEGAMIPLPTPDEIVASLSDPCLAKKSKDPSQAEGMDEADLTDLCAEIENSLKRDEGTSTRSALAPTLRLGKRLGAPHSKAVVSASGPSHVGTSLVACELLGAAVSGHAGKSGAEIPEDDFGTATRGEEIDLTLFPLTPGPYQMSYPYEGAYSPPYTKEEWNGPHAPEDNILFSHEAELNSRYTGLVTAKNRLQEKFDQKAGELNSQKDAASLKVKELQTELTDAWVASIGYKDAVDGLREEVTRFVGSGVESLVRKLLSSDKFHAALAHVASLGINYSVGRVLRMGRTEVEFEVASQKVSNFHIGAKADFDKLLLIFLLPIFPFLEKLLRLPEERIEKTKRSKNDQKPTRNGKKTKSQEQDKEFSQKSQPDQPDTVKLSQREKQRSQKPKLQVKGPLLSSVQRLKSLFEVLKSQGPKLLKEQSCFIKKKREENNTRAEFAISESSIYTTKGVKECSTCGSWYTKECCSIGNLNDKIIVPVSDSSLHCAVCGTPVNGPYCHGCTLIRTKFEKDLFTYCVDNGVFQNFQNTSESSNDNTNVVNAPREPSVVDQDPGVNISQDPPQIDHNCCYECGDSLNGIFCQQCICEFCGKGAHFGYNCPPKDPIISELEPCYNRNFDCFPHDSQTLPQQYFCCENCGGPHETYQCQPMNQEYFYSHSSGFDQFQPPQFSDVYQTPPVASMEMLHAQTDLIESMQNFLKKYDHIPHNEKSIKLLLAEEKFLKIKQVVEEEQTQPEYLQELLQSLLKDLQILNEIQPLKQETPNQIQKDQEEKSIVELLAEERFQKANQALNESQSSQEMRIQDLEIQKQQSRARSRKIIIDDDDDNLGFYAVHPNTIHIPVSQNVEPKDSLIMGDGHINTTPETETISVETLVSNPSESDDFSLGECNLFDIDDSYYEKSTSRLAHLAPISPEIVEVCVDDDDTDDDDDYDDDFYDCVDIEEDGGEIDLDISKIVDISLREKLVESYLLIEKINAFSLSPPIPISPIFCPSSTIPVVDLDLPLEEADVPSFSDDSILRGIESDRDSGEDTTSIDALPLDDSMILSEYESFTFDDEPVMAEVNVFDEINTSELSYPGIGENVVLDEEEDTFTFTTRSFLPFVTYPEVLPASYSTGSEDKVFRILEDSWFNIVEGQSNSHNFH
ncbi:hypothetical protein Tco_0785839 [Tanacetum coccineum]